jgi:hypothetical protein
MSPDLLITSLMFVAFSTTSPYLFYPNLLITSLMFVAFSTTSPYLFLPRSAHYVTHVCCLINYQPILVLPKSAHYVTHVNYITNYHPLCNLGLLRGMRFMAILLCPVLFLYLAQSCRERGQAASVRLAPCWALFRGSWAARAWRDGLRVLDVHTRCTCVLRVCKCLHVCACVCVGVCGFVWVNVCSCVCWCLSGVPG